MPPTAYWRRELRACIRSSFPDFVGEYQLHDPTPDHPPAARVVLTGDDAPELLARPLEMHSFVVTRSRGDDKAALVILNRDPFPRPYHPDHDGIDADTEPHQRHDAVTHVSHPTGRTKTTEEGDLR